MRSPFEIDRPMYFMMAMASFAVGIITGITTFYIWCLIFLTMYLLSAYLLSKSIKRQAIIEFREYRIEILKHEGITHQLNKIIELLEKPKVKKRGRKK